MRPARDVHELDYRSARRGPGPTGTGTHIRLRVGRPIPRNPLDHFLTARWRLHHRVNAGTVTAQLTHNTRPLHAAELLGLNDGLIATTGLATPTEPPTSPASAVASAYRPRRESDPNEGALAPSMTRRCRFVIELSNTTLTNLADFAADNPDLTLTINRADLEEAMIGSNPLQHQIGDGSAVLDGDAAVLQAPEAQTRLP